MTYVVQLYLKFSSTTMGSRHSTGTEDVIPAFAGAINITVGAGVRVGANGVAVCLHADTKLADMLSAKFQYQLDQNGGVTKSADIEAQLCKNVTVGTGVRHGADGLTFCTHADAKVDDKLSAKVQYQLDQNGDVTKSADIEAQLCKNVRVGAGVRHGADGLTAYTHADAKVDDKLSAKVQYQLDQNGDVTKSADIEAQLCKNVRVGAGVRHGADGLTVCTHVDAKVDDKLSAKFQYQLNQNGDVTKKADIQAQNVILVAGVVAGVTDGADGVIASAQAEAEFDDVILAKFQHQLGQNGNVSTY